MNRFLYTLFASLAILLLLLLNIRLHSPGDHAETLSQLEFLGVSLNDGGAERMQSHVPKGYLFTWALYATRLSNWILALIHLVFR